MKIPKNQITTPKHPITSHQFSQASQSQRGNSKVSELAKNVFGRSGNKGKVER